MRTPLTRHFQVSPVSVGVWRAGRQLFKKNTALGLERGGLGGEVLVDADINS